MTPQQKNVYNIIKKHIKKHGFSPKATEVGEELGITRQRADKLIKRLVKLGKLKELRAGLYGLV